MFCLLVAFGPVLGAGTQSGRPLPSLYGKVEDSVTRQPVAAAVVALSLRGATIAAPTVVETDAAGLFRYDGLSPGQYSVTVTKKGFSGGLYGQRFDYDSPTWIEVLPGSGDVGPITIAVRKLGSLSGVVTDAEGEPVGSVEVWALHATWLAGASIFRSVASIRADAKGAFRIPNLPKDDYVVAATLPNAGTVYFPFATWVGQATPIALDVAEDRLGIGIRISTAPQDARTISGDVVGATGLPMSVVLDRAVSPTDLLGTQTILTDNTGRFRFTGVLPGRYSINVIPSLDSHRPRPGGPSVAPSEWGQVHVDVQDSNVENVRIEVRPGHTISGRLSWPKGSTPPVGPGQSLVIEAVPLSGHEFGLVPTFTIQSDGTFTSSRLQPERYAIGVRRATGWFAESIISAGAEVAGRFIDLSSDVAGVEIVLTQAPTVISGVVRNKDGQPTDNAFVLVYPASPSDWDTRSIVLTPPNRFSRVRPERNGEYRIPGLPAGDYLVAAYVGPLPAAGWQNAATITDLRLRGSLIHLARGQAVTKDFQTDSQLVAVVR
jgi:hypothetical protein